MGTFADSLFSVLMSWVRALVNAFWALFSSENTTALEFLGRNWLMIALVIVAAGLVIDWLVWLIRWQPYHLWARRVRRWLRIAEPEADAEDDEETAEAGASSFDAAQEDEEDDVRLYRPAHAVRSAEIGEEDGQDERELWLPQPFDEEEEQAALRAAEDVPDEELRAYPGMRYGARAQNTDGEDELGSTQRYAAVHSEGPGAAEVKSRRAEIDAWQLQMQEEARQKAQAERARLEQERLEQERLAQEAYEAEQARLAQEAYEAEQARLAQEAYEAEQERLAQEEYEAEQERLAQEEYERQLAEYEKQKAQYERDLAEYERQKAIYDAQQAALAAAQKGTEAAAELAADPAAAGDEPAGTQRRRRRSRQAAVSYSDMVEGEHVDELPPPPSWPRMERTQTAPAAEQKDEREAQPQKENAFLSRMARMIEPEEEDIASLHALPPRVDMKDAYKPARKPAKPGRRNQ